MEAELEEDKCVPGAVESLVSCLLFHQIVETDLFSILN